MARQSLWEHLKPDIEAEFRSGKKPYEVLKVYSQIPKSTVYDWYKEFQSEFRNNSDLPESITCEVLPPQKLVALDGGEQLSDFALARKTLRAIAKNFNQPGAAVGVQAALGLMKLTQMRAELPKHILDEIEESTVEHERIQLRDKPPEDLAREYREKIG